MAFIGADHSITLTFSAMLDDGEALIARIVTRHPQLAAPVVSADERGRAAITCSVDDATSLPEAISTVIAALPELGDVVACETQRYDEMS